MAKDTYYFPHDAHARYDPKCSALINDFGFEGYGLYWSIIELLHEQGGRIKKFPKLYDGMAHSFKIEKELLVKQIEAMLHDYELLLQDDNYIWSERVLKNLENRKDKKEAKQAAGRLGGIQSGIVRNSKSKQNEAVLEANEPKESKGKESKGKKSKGKESKEEEVSVFVETLKQNSAYKSIDIDREIDKMRAWLLTPRGKGRQLTKGFIVNWLNKIDVPLKEGEKYDKYKNIGEEIHI